MFKSAIIVSAFVISTAANASTSNLEGFKNIKFDTTTVSDLVAAGGKCKTFRTDYGSLGYKVGTTCKMESNTVFGVPVDEYTVEFNTSGKIIDITFVTADVSNSFSNAARATLGSATEMSSEQPNRNIGKFSTEYNSTWKFPNNTTIRLYTKFDPTSRYTSFFEVLTFASSNKSSFEQKQVSKDF